MKWQRHILRWLVHNEKLCQCSELGKQLHLAVINLARRCDVSSRLVDTHRRISLYYNFFAEKLNKQFEKWFFYTLISNYGTVRRTKSCYWSPTIYILTPQAVIILGQCWPEDVATKVDNNQVWLQPSDAWVHWRSNILLRREKVMLHEFKSCFNYYFLML